MTNRTKKSQQLEINNLPLFLTVEETARLFRVSRSAMYELVNVWLATGGSNGFMATRMGRTIRVPGWAVVHAYRIGLSPQAFGAVMSDLRKLHADAAQSDQASGF